MYTGHLSLVQLRAQPRSRDSDSDAVMDSETATDADSEGSAERRSCTCGVDCARFHARDRGTPLACWQPEAAWCKLSSRGGSSRSLAEKVLPQKCFGGRTGRDVEGAAALLLEMQGANPSPRALEGNARYCYEVGHCGGGHPLPANASVEEIEARCDAKYSDPHGGVALWRRVTVGEVVSGMPSHGFGLLACALRDYYLCDAALCHREFCTPKNEAKYGHLADRPWDNHENLGSLSKGQC